MSRLFRLKHLFEMSHRMASSAPSSAVRKLPHLLDPKTVLGGSVITASYFFYLWVTDDGQAPSDYPKRFDVSLLQTSNA